MSAGFVQTRRGILDHLHQRRLSLREFGIYSLLLLLADKASGVWWGCSIALASHFGDGGSNLRTYKDALNNLEDKGYIKRFRTQGQRGNYPILIDKYLVSYGVLTGQRVNASESTSYEKIVYELRTETRPEPVPDSVPETRPEPVPYSIPYTLNLKDKVSQIEPPSSSSEVNGDNPEVISQAERIVNYIYRDILENKESPSEKTLTISVDKTIEALSTRSYERIKGCLDYARKNKFWYEGIGTSDFPVAFFLKSLPSIEEQAQEAHKKASRKAHVENKAAQMGVKPKTKPAAPAVKSQFFKNTQEEDD